MKDPITSLKGSARFRTTKKELDKCIPNIKRRLGKTLEQRLNNLHQRRIIVTNIRQARQKENALIDWPFELIDQATNEVFKKGFMTEHEANKKNLAIRDLGMAWRRSGY